MILTSIVATGVTAYAAFWLGKNWTGRSGRGVEEKMMPFYKRQKFPITCPTGSVIVLKGHRRVRYRCEVTLVNVDGEYIEVWTHRRILIRKSVPAQTRRLAATISASDFVRYELPTATVKD